MIKQKLFFLFLCPEEVLLLEEVVVATDNVKHLSLFAEARSWEEVGPASLAREGW